MAIKLLVGGPLAHAPWRMHYKFVPKPPIMLLSLPSTTCFSNNENNIHINNIWICLILWLTLQFKCTVLCIIGKEMYTEWQSSFYQGIQATSFPPSSKAKEDDGKVAAVDDEGGQRPFSDIDPNPVHICDNV